MQLFDESVLNPAASSVSTESSDACITPLAWRLAPVQLDDYVGQSHLLGDGKPLRNLIESDRICSMILWGPPGCGKTGLSRLVAHHSNAHYISLNAVMAKVADIKGAIDQARSHQRLNKQTILFIDEIHRFSKTQQDALLPSVENGLITLVGATTENPYFSVIPGLTSRCQIFELHPHTDEDLRLIIRRAVSELNKEHTLELESDAETALIHYAKGDARKAVTVLEVASQSCADQLIRQETIESLTQSQGLASNLDSHYDLISAYIKSMRGSDDNAALYWLARLLKGGEDPRFITRRMVIFASEDIGIADPNALNLATSAHRAAETIGMPEVQITLSHVTTYLARAPKSNETYAALKKANHWIDSGHVYDVPKHLRDAHYKQAKALGHGVGYKYSHTDTSDQAFLPEDVSFFD